MYVHLLEVMESFIGTKTAFTDEVVKEFTTFDIFENEITGTIRFSRKLART